MTCECPGPHQPSSKYAEFPSHVFIEWVWGMTFGIVFPQTRDLGHRGEKKSTETKFALECTARSLDLVPPFPHSSYSFLLVPPSSCFLLLLPSPSFSFRLLPHPSSPFLLLPPPSSSFLLPPPPPSLSFFLSLPHCLCLLPCEGQLNAFLRALLQQTRMLQGLQ